jgi:hypothetical protein
VANTSSSNADIVLCCPSVTTDDKRSHSQNSRAFLATIETVMYENVLCMDLPWGCWCRVTRIRFVAITKRQIISLKDKEVIRRILFYINNRALILKEVTARVQSHINA